MGFPLVSSPEGHGRPELPQKSWKQSRRQPTPQPRTLPRPHQERHCLSDGEGEPQPPAHLPRPGAGRGSAAVPSTPVGCPCPQPASGHPGHPRECTCSGVSTGWRRVVRATPKPAPRAPPHPRPGGRPGHRGGAASPNATLAGCSELLTRGRASPAVLWG